VDGVRTRFGVGQILEDGEKKIKKPKMKVKLMNENKWWLKLPVTRATMMAWTLKSYR
jgi:hypothetical protein